MLGVIRILFCKFSCDNKLLNEFKSIRPCCVLLYHVRAPFSYWLELVGMDRNGILLMVSRIVLTTEFIQTLKNSTLFKKCTISPHKQEKSKEELGGLELAV